MHEDGDPEDDGEVWYFSEYDDIETEIEDGNTVNETNCNLGEKT